MVAVEMEVRVVAGCIVADEEYEEVDAEVVVIVTVTVEDNAVKGAVEEVDVDEMAGVVAAKVIKNGIFRNDKML